MSKTMYADVPQPERMQLLATDCDSQEQTSYMKDLTQEEIDVKNETISSNCIKVFELEEELTGIKDDFKSRIKPLREETKELCGHVKTRKEQVNGTLFHFADQEASVMNTYDENGEFVSSRRLRPDEKQAKLFVAHGRTADGN